MAGAAHSRLKKAKMKTKILLLCGAASLLSACAATSVAPEPPAVTPAPQPSASEQLNTLFKESDEASLRRNPLNALFRGDMRYAGELGDMFTEEYYAAERRASQEELQRLAAIDRGALSLTDQLAYDVFKRQSEVTLRGLQEPLLALSALRPIDHFSGIQTWYPDVASGEGAAPFKTVEDYENNLRRHRQFPQLIDKAIARFREGMAAGVVQPKLVVRNVIEQLDLQLKQGVEGSTFYGPVGKFPEGISAANQARLRAAHAAVIRDEIRPAYVRLRDFLKNEYVPVAREGVGLVHMKGGPLLYQYLIEQSTTLPLTADAIHNLGLGEVARIKREMETVKTQVGFKGSLPAFFEHLRTSKKYQPPSREWLRERYEAVGKRVDARVGELFALRPKTALEIRPVPAYREKTDAAGSYNSGTPDGARPGVFYYNTYDLPARFTWGIETLFLHEAVPGHHFQISLAQENEALPNFMRFGGNTAFVEGWALYAETLWDELGVETDPLQRFGGLNDEMLRAMRLVVDTGIHAKGWSRDQAINYMLDNSSMGRTDATAEVERYIAIPGQALAYKLGQLKILELRARAEKALGAKFDIRGFHAQVLDSGALPLTVLDAKIDRWIAAQKG
jgi:uncharacterized protein (DUF885 family)